MLKMLWPYVLIATLAAAAGALIDHQFGVRRLSEEQAARANDAQRHANDLSAISRVALDAEQRAIAAHDTAASAVAAVDAQFTKERNDHEADNRNYRVALAAGTERLHVAVRNCSATSADGVSGASGAAGVVDGAPAYADIDAAVAERVFAVAGDDQNEIDKLKTLQGWACAIRPQTPGCSN
ncbi:lysozyme [Burkholderia sp. ABCPW 14]|uniref:lysis system i-spanin subunit Rz n=1 Tax=Burkholderia sp. ABCPW 14 TaxID=1637860 RepID=UPI000770BEA8|nr:lysis system i-spanin subunit Rz [Burkholderia sp. ABCPW 14]KVD70111.1 lysozyme [Burkholderia sp. ABCPW 14]